MKNSISQKTEKWSSAENKKAANRIDAIADSQANDALQKEHHSGTKDRRGSSLWNDPTFQKQFMGSYGVRSDIEPEVTDVERPTLAQVMNLMALEQVGQARKMLKATITQDTSALFDFILGNINFQEDDFESAAYSYSQAIDKFPDFLRAHKNLAMVEVRRNSFQTAIPALTRSIELGGGGGLTYGLLGFSFTSVGDHVNAESAYRQAMMLQPDSVDWQMGLAQSLFKQEKYASAAALCGQLISRDPDNSDYWRLQANAYLGLGETMKAAQNYEYLRTLGKAGTESLNKLGDIYVKEKMLDIAADAYAEALAKNTSQSPENYIRNAKVLANYGGLNEANTLIGQIKEGFSGSFSEKDEVELLRLEARIALNNGADEKQAELLQEIVRIDPMDGEALILLGQYFARQNNPEKAIFFYERAEAIEAVEAKAKIRHAQLLVQESKYQEAVPMLESALRIEYRSEVEEYLAQVRAAAKSRQ